jgi:transcriptional regulator with PAS, ATPase and Fis domain
MQPGEHVLTREHLQRAGSAELAAPPPVPGTGPRRFADLKREWERHVLEDALSRHGGNRTAAARSLGITVRNLYYKMERLGIA